MKTNTTTAAKLLEVSRQLGLSLPEVMLRRERELNETPPEVVYEKLRVAYGIMRQAVEESLREPHKTMGGLIGGEARKLAEYRAAGKNLCGETVSRAICYAMGVLEVSASMGLIVAAPTAGASGVLPGVLIALQEQYGLTERQMLDALLVASAIGVVVAENSGISGAAGGCQAEVGTASAMAAASSVYLMGGSPEQCFAAAGLAIQNMLGLVCDPIAGLVEAPCQARNAAGASNALVSAELVLAGVPEVIPFDEVVEAARQVGHALPESLRETALGGIAATPDCLPAGGADRLRQLPRVRLNISLRLTRAYTLFDGEKSFGSFAWQKCCPRKCGIYVRKNRICSCRVLGTFV